MRACACLILLVPFAAALAGDPPPVPATPAAIKSVLLARPFRLTTPFEYAWRKERPSVSEGYLLVIEVDPALVFPRQLAEPVLYVDRQTGQRVNFGNKSGHVVVIVPGDINPKEPLIWFGAPELPERVDAAMIDGQRTQALAAKILPVPPEQFTAALHTGGEKLLVADEKALLREAAKLVLRFSPADAKQVEPLLMESKKPAATQPANPREPRR